MEHSSDSEKQPITGVIPAPPSPFMMSTHNSRQAFLWALFRALDEHDVCYCMLNRWEGLPEDLSSDVDIAVQPSDRAKLSAVFGELRDQGFLPVQCLNFAVNAYYFVFYWFQDLSLESVAVAVMFEHRRGGLILTSGEKLVAGRIRRDSVWIPNAKTELHYLLAKTTLKEEIPPHQQARFKSLVEEIGASEAEQVAGELYGEKWKRRVVEACLDGTLSRFLVDLSRPLRRKAVLHHPLSQIRNLFGDSVRLFRRWLEPTGIFLVVLGPDGVGKSTVLGQLVEKLGPAFRRHQAFHFRPQIIKPQKETGIRVTNPHSDPVRGTFGSVAVLFGLFLDFWAGHLLVTRPLMARSGLVIFDRYFHDIMIDNIRYRYGGPLWLPRILAHFIPPPDLLFLVLDADSSVILSRKQELSPEELKRMRSSYSELASQVLHSGLIKTDESITESVGAAARTVALYMAKRFERQHHSWLARHEPAGQTKPNEAIQP
jgi:thymidylate kinase